MNVSTFRAKTMPEIGTFPADNSNEVKLVLTFSFLYISTVDLLNFLHS